ncbi:MAG: ADP-ribosylglycohydrolase family protein, partial [Clostridia bacterium]|nr:ADP-ribosylglycohydrolase family protein [Clostridia bacterium]
INCGDDTDCTGATVGAILGIIGAGEAIPPDWEEYIGDSIKSCAIDVSMKRCCKSCTELTNRIINLVPVVLGSFAVPVEYTDEKTQYVEKPKFYIPQFDIPTNPYTYDEIEDLVHTKARVEFDKMPLLKSGESVKMTVGFLNSMYDPRHLTIKLILPQGWTADYTRHKRIMNEATASPVVEEYWSADITAGENIDMINKVYVEVACEGRPVTKVIPVVILG